MYVIAKECEKEEQALYEMKLKEKREKRKQKKMKKEQQIKDIGNEVVEGDDDVSTEKKIKTANDVTPVQPNESNESVSSSSKLQNDHFLPQNPCESPSSNVEMPVDNIDEQ